MVGQAELAQSVSPDWMRVLPTVVQTVMTGVVRKGFLPDLQVETVRQAGEAFWLDQPLMGPVQTARLGRAVGGWPNLPSIELRRIEQQIQGLRRRLDELEAALSVLKRSQTS